MLKANEVMTHTLATCAPNDDVAHVAALMKDHDIGDVLVVENGKLRGIVTDRDLALQALTGEHDPLNAPVHKFMTKKVITGNADWNMKHVANTMARHQIRRLPILQDGKLAGIISLGDVALYEGRKDMVSKSLKEISKPNGKSTTKIIGRNAALIGLGLATVASMMTWLASNRTGQSLRKQITRKKFYDTAKHAVRNTRSKIDDVASSKAVRNLRDRARTNLHDISTRLPIHELRPSKRRFVWFG